MFAFAVTLGVCESVHTVLHLVSKSDISTSREVLSPTLGANFSHATDPDTAALPVGPGAMPAGFRFRQLGRSAEAVIPVGRLVLSLSPVSGVCRVARPSACSPTSCSADSQTIAKLPPFYRRSTAELPLFDRRFTAIRPPNYRRSTAELPTFDRRTTVVRPPNYRRIVPF